MDSRALTLTVRERIERIERRIGMTSSLLASWEWEKLSAWKKRMTRLSWNESQELWEIERRALGQYSEELNAGNPDDSK